MIVFFNKRKGCEVPQALEEALGSAAQFLVDSQTGEGDWKQQLVTGVFNHNCMITYANYRNIFPIWALSEVVIKECPLIKLHFTLTSSLPPTKFAVLSKTTDKAGSFGKRTLNQKCLRSRNNEVQHCKNTSS